ncbi:uncharacterized protein BDR25DRAFT_359274 [Lindgomyces ingoldianus]|uniref:Uncharacterized protein n=1 Tax=Lindgomyces ingoldianus TaxID=673940 RepID=A0ACB6QJS0_9PLEO|nr:uncharacterized protein BDR25DRAFT_359274 [Lindgomyces ingoldianus]KAF2466765.1 hypothetical protein BDR25DRAFT_359274 [Lindgomyces ingoldianus]
MEISKLKLKHLELAKVPRQSDTLKIQKLDNLDPLNWMHTIREEWGVDGSKVAVDHTLFSSWLWGKAIYPQKPFCIGNVVSIRDWRTTKQKKLKFLKQHQRTFPSSEGEVQDKLEAFEIWLHDYIDKKNSGFKTTDDLPHHESLYVRETQFKSSRDSTVEAVLSKLSSCIVVNFVSDIDYLMRRMSGSHSLIRALSFTIPSLRDFGSFGQSVKAAQSASPSSFTYPFISSEAPLDAHSVLSAALTLLRVLLAKALHSLATPRPNLALIFMQASNLGLAVTMTESTLSSPSVPSICDSGTQPAVLQTVLWTDAHLLALVADRASTRRYCLHGSAMSRSLLSLPRVTPVKSSLNLGHSTPIFFRGLAILYIERRSSYVIEACEAFNVPIRAGMQLLLMAAVCSCARQDTLSGQNPENSKGEVGAIWALRLPSPVPHPEYEILVELVHHTESNPGLGPAVEAGTAEAGYRCKYELERSAMPVSFEAQQRKGTISLTSITWRVASWLFSAAAELGVLVLLFSSLQFCWRCYVAFWSGGTEIKLLRILRALFLKSSKGHANDRVKILDRCNEAGRPLHRGKILTIVVVAISEIQTRSIRKVFSRGSKNLRCQDFAGLEASIFGRKTLQICRVMSSSYLKEYGLQRSNIKDSLDDETTIVFSKANFVPPIASGKSTSLHLPLRNGHPQIAKLKSSQIFLSSTTPKRFARSPHLTQTPKSLKPNPVIKNSLNPTVICRTYANLLLKVLKCFNGRVPSPLLAWCEG